MYVLHSANKVDRWFGHNTNYIFLWFLHTDAIETSITSGFNGTTNGLCGTPDATGRIWFNLIQFNSIWFDFISFDPNRFDLIYLIDWSIWSIFIVVFPAIKTWFEVTLLRDFAFSYRHNIYLYFNEIVKSTKLWWVYQWYVKSSLQGNCTYNHYTLFIFYFIIIFFLTDSKKSMTVTARFLKKFVSEQNQTKPNWWL